MPHAANATASSEPSHPNPATSPLDPWRRSMVQKSNPANTPKQATTNSTTMTQPIPTDMIQTMSRATKPDAANTRERFHAANCLLTVCNICHTLFVNKSIN
jgi:hypothetical protein